MKNKTLNHSRFKEIYMNYKEILDAVINWIFEHKQLSEDFKNKFPDIAKMYEED